MGFHSTLSIRDLIHVDTNTTFYLFEVLYIMTDFKMIFKNILMLPKLGFLKLVACHHLTDMPFFLY